MAHATPSPWVACSNSERKLTAGSRESALFANPGQAFATNGSCQPPASASAQPMATGATAAVKIDGNVSAEVAAKDVLAAQNLAVHQNGAANAGAQRDHDDIRLPLCRACVAFAQQRHACVVFDHEREAHLAPAPGRKVEASGIVILF